MVVETNVIKISTQLLIAIQFVVNHVGINVKIQKLVIIMMTVKVNGVGM